MDEEQYEALINYLQNGKYPPECSKSQKFVLRRCSKNYVVKDNQLFYIDYKLDHSAFYHLVLHGKEEKERVFTECHLTAGGHKGRDATIAKIKEILLARLLQRS